MTRLVPFFWWISYLSTRIAAFFIFKVEFEGRLERRSAPAIVVGKHSSYWDIPLVAGVVRHVYRTYPHFEMGTFAGYSMLGRISWYLELLGGFPVMRPKDALRLKRMFGQDRAKLSQTMAEVNDHASKTRAAILRDGHVLCYFPEGTRNPSVQRFRSVHEIEEAAALEGIGRDLHVLVVAPIYGPPRRPTIPLLRRRSCRVVALDAIAVAGSTPHEVLAIAQKRVEEVFGSSRAGDPASGPMEEKSP